MGCFYAGYNEPDQYYSDLVPETSHPFVTSSTMDPVSRFAVLQNEGTRPGKGKGKRGDFQTGKMKMEHTFMEVWFKLLFLKFMECICPVKKDPAESPKLAKPRKLAN